MGRTNGASQEQIEFSHDEPATFPRRTYTGDRVRLNIIRAMSVTHEHFKAASEQADKLINVLRRAVRHDSIPPAQNASGGQR